MNARLPSPREEHGVAVAIAMMTVMITGLLAAALIAAATFFLHSSSRDSANKRALAAAQAGLNAGVYRLNRISASPSGSFANNCITDREVAWSTTSPHCPAESAFFNVTGASSTYYLTPEMSASLTGMPTVATECGSTGGDRCVTAIGTVNGVTRRLQERIKAAELFNLHGMLGLKGVEVNSSSSWTGVNFQVTADTGSNGAITYGANVTPPSSPYGCYVGPSGSAPAGCAITRYPQAITVPSVDTLPFGTTQTTNSNATIAAGYTASGRVLSIAAAATLTLAAGDYNFCSVTVGNGATLQAASGARVRVFVDSPSRTGSGCTTGGTFNAGVIAGTTSAKINPSTTAGQIEVYSYGTVTPPANLASPPPATCKEDFVFVNGSSATSNNLYIYAPDSIVSIQSNAYQYGAVVACQMIYWALSATARWDFPATGIRPTAGIGLITGSFRECTPLYTGDPESGCG
jgi:hypothetical protein